MNIIATGLPEVLVLEPRVFVDHRGCFYESWNARAFADATGLSVEFVQDNHSYSVRNVLRGIHYQLAKPQGRLVRVVDGAVLDVAVDLRRSSPTFRRWVALELSAESRREVWIPPGFGHGFVVRSETATVLYKTTEYWIAELDRSVRWNDPQLAIDWGVDAPILADRDAGAPGVADAEVFP
jgi:dTDP-4-dehydrorhamnose 3,5-epimerase